VGAIQNRIDNILARKAAGKRYGKTNLAKLQAALADVGGDGGGFDQASYDAGKSSAAAQEQSNRDAARGR
jgi:hypothetical protein